MLGKADVADGAVVSGSEVGCVLSELPEQLAPSNPATTKTQKPHLVTPLPTTTIQLNNNTLLAELSSRPLN